MRWLGAVTENNTGAGTKSNMVARQRCRHRLATRWIRPWMLFAVACEAEEGWLAATRLSISQVGVSLTVSQLEIVRAG